MLFEKELIPGKILKRYKRFLADIELADGEIITAHTPNTGSMKTCWEAGWKVLISESSNPQRKLKHTLELTHNGESWIGVNTSRPNKIVYEFIENELIPELKGYDRIKTEVSFGKSRIDLLLSKQNESCYIEIKNVTLKDDSQKALFPDSVSTRGQKHLKELIEIKKVGHRAVIFFLVQREDVTCFSPAKEIDPEYARLLHLALEAGVEALVYQCQISEKGIFFKQKLPLVLCD